MMKTFLTRRQWLTGLSILAGSLVVKPAQARGMDHFIETSPPEDLPDDLTFLDETGQEQRLADFQGKVVLLSLWATWCVPCVLEMPSLNRLQQKLSGDDFVILPVSVDRGGAARVRRFYDAQSISDLPILLDSQMSVQRGLRSSGLPLTLLLNRQGQEIGRSLGGENWDSPAALSLIQSALKA